MTAVEFLSERYNYITLMRNRDEISESTSDELYVKFLKEAKEMEKQQLKEIEYLNNPVLTPVSQIINAYLSGVSDGFDVSKVTRFEVIDHTTKAKEKDTQGRAFTNYDCSVELSLQDDNKTLKIFVNDR